MKLSLIWVSALLLAAHFLRDGSLALCGVSLVLPLLLLVHRAWAARALQVALLLAALEWSWTLMTLVRARLEAGQPWLRLACILGAVAVWTAASALVFRSPELRRRYRLEDHGPRTLDE